MDEERKALLKEKCHEYCEHVQLLFELHDGPWQGGGAIYGLDNIRADLHEELVELAGLEKEDLWPFTNNLAKLGFRGDELFFQILDIIETKKKVKNVTTQ